MSNDEILKKLIALQTEANELIKNTNFPIKTSDFHVYEDSLWALGDEELYFSLIPTDEDFRENGYVFERANKIYEDLTYTGFDVLVDCDGSRETVLFRNDKFKIYDDEDEDYDNY